MMLANSAAYLINDLGKDLTLRKVNETFYDVNTGGMVKTETDTSVKGLVLQFKDKQFEGSIIEKGDRKIVLRTSDSVVPDTQDIVLDGADEYTLIEVRQIEESGNDVIYICQGRH